MPFQNTHFYRRAINSPIHTTNCTNTFIAVAEDCPATTAQIPPNKGDEKTIAGLQYEIVKKNPYKFTSDDVLFQVYTQLNEVTKIEMKAERERFFSKGQTCFRSCMTMGREAEGIKLYEKAIQLEPGYSIPYMNLGYNFLEKGKPKKFICKISATTIKFCGNTTSRRIIMIPSLKK